QQPSSTGESQSANPPPLASSKGTALPTINIVAPHKPPPKPSAPVTAGIPPAPVASPPVASPYQTGAPNIAGGNPVVPQLASQMTFSGADLNARPLAAPG